MEHLKAYINDVADFPSPGILFKDISPLLRDASAMQDCIAAMATQCKKADITAVAGIEARGFIFGALVAQALNVGFIPLRKPGKLPSETKRVDYQLEYGTASLEVHQSAISAQDKIVLIDDVLATGGTAAAACELITRLGGEIIACLFVIELTQLQGRAPLSTTPVYSLIEY